MDIDKIAKAGKIMNDNIIMDIEKRVLTYINNVVERDPIFFSDLYKDDTNINVIETIINKLKEDSVLSEYSSNIYYKPMNTPFGELGINKEKLIKRLYLKQNDEIIGYVTGPTLWNYYRLTTQISNKRWIVSNKVKVNYEDNDLRVKLIVPKIIINNENYKVLQILDVIEDKNNLYIQDLNYNKYYEFLENIAQSDTKTIDNLYELSYLYNNKVQDDVKFILNSNRKCL